MTMVTLACLNQGEQAVLNFVGEAEAAGNVTVTRTWMRVRCYYYCV